MPFFQGAYNTTANNSRFNDVAGNQYHTEDQRHYAGDDRPSYNNVTHGDAFHGAVQGGNVGGRGNYYGDAARAAIASSTPQLQLNPSALAASDTNELLEANLALTRVQYEAKQYRQRADRLAAQLADTQTRLIKVESELAAARQELARCRPGGL